MRTVLVTMISAAATLAFTTTAAAQELSFELRGGLNRPLSDFRNEGVEARGDAGFAGDVIFNLTPRFSVYGGYAWDRFGCEGCGDDNWLVSRGFEAGGKFIFVDPDLGPGILPWARAGLVANKAEFEVGDVEATSDMGLGLQASLGVDIPLGDVLSFSPALRYQRFTADFDVIPDVLQTEQTLSFISLDFGLHIHPQFSGR